MAHEPFPRVLFLSGGRPHPAAGGIQSGQRR